MIGDFSVLGVVDQPSECNVMWVTVASTTLSATAMMSMITLTVSECLWACQSVTTFKCASAVYNTFSSTCQLFSVNQYTVGVTSLSSPLDDYYEPHCCESCHWCYLIVIVLLFTVN